MQKDWKQKFPKKLLVHFRLKLQKRIDPRKIGSIRERKMLESLRIFARLKEYKFILQWVRLRLHLLKVQYDLWKIYFTVTWKTMGTSTFTNCLNSLKNWCPEQIARWIWYRKKTRISTFCPFYEASHCENIKIQSSKLEAEFALHLWLALQEVL